MRRIIVTLTALCAVAGLAFPAADPDVLRIGTTSSLMENVPPSRRDLFASEFTSLVHDFTGLKSATLAGLDPWTSAKQVEEGKWDLGVFQGVEFAWVQPRFPKLQPFMVATNEVPLKAALVVNNDDKAAGFADLKGASVIMLQGRLHCRLFADKGAGMKANKFFGKFAQTRSGEDALDAILLHKARAAIVDTAALDLYKNLQPGRFKRLTIVAESDIFPPGVIALERGSLSDKLLKTMQDGMLKANQSDRGRETLAAFHVKSFAAVPTNFQEQLKQILKAYPSPQSP
jgi:ABC-type phosphate/phosphonate transport system substrate-binding protein